MALILSGAGTTTLSPGRARVRGAYGYSGAGLLVLAAGVGVRRTLVLSAAGTLLTDLVSIRMLNGHGTLKAEGKPSIRFTPEIDAVYAPRDGVLLMQE